MKQKEINQGYEIRERFVVGAIGIALGENPAAPAPFVTWNYRGQEPMHFFWGHYFSDKQAAYDDYEHRIEQEIEYYKNRTGKDFPLPMLCLSVEPSSGDIINIKLGQTADYANEKIGVTKAQEAAMRHGSMFGWLSKAADPKNYDENGQLKRLKPDEPER